MVQLAAKSASQGSGTGKRRKTRLPQHGVPRELRTGGGSDRSRERFAEVIGQILNKPGEQLSLAKGEIKTDPAYQRSLNMRRVYRIANNWNWVACGVLVVSMRGPSYFVVDGQHRLAAARVVSHVSDLPCIAFELSQIDEARGFLALNMEHSPPTMIERWPALLAAGDRAARFVDDLVGESGFEIKKTGTGMRNAVQCAGLLHGYATENPTRLKRLWPLIAELHRNTTIGSQIIKGMWRIEARMPSGYSLTDERWMTRMKHLGWEYLNQSIRQVAMIEGKIGAPQCAEGLLRAINRGLQHPLRVEIR